MLGWFNNFYNLLKQFSKSIYGGIYWFFKPLYSFISTLVIKVLVLLGFINREFFDAEYASSTFHRHANKVLLFSLKHLLLYRIIPLVISVVLFKVLIQ